jgi:hypothetical protein
MFTRQSTELNQSWQNMCNASLFAAIAVTTASSAEKVEDALRKGANVNAENKDGDNSLIVAIHNSIILQSERQTEISARVVKLLVDAGGEAKNKQDAVEIFNYLFRRSKTDLLELLLSRGVLTRINQSDIQFAIHEIAHHGTMDSLPVMKLCIDEAVKRGIVISELFGFGGTVRVPLLHAAVSSFHPDVRLPFIRLLLTYDVDVFQKNDDGLIAEEVATRSLSDLSLQGLIDMTNIVSMLRACAVTARFASFESGLR